MSNRGNQIDTDISEVTELVRNLTSPDLRKAVGTATKRASKPILDATKANFKRLVSGQGNGRSGSLVGLRANSVRRRYGSYSMAVRTLPVIVAKTIWQRTKNPFTVATLRTRNQNTDFRALFFELGTQLRRTRNGYNRGSITAGGYFARAVSAHEQEAMRSMSEEILQALDQRAKR